jgi:hypothetical protein
MTTTFDNQWIYQVNNDQVSGQLQQRLQITKRISDVEALDAVRRLERDRFRKQVYQVNKDQESGRYYIEFRKKIKNVFKPN